MFCGYLTPPPTFQPQTRSAGDPGVRSEILTMPGRGFQAGQGCRDINKRQTQRRTQAQPQVSMHLASLSVLELHSASGVELVLRRKCYGAEPCGWRSISGL